MLTLLLLASAPAFPITTALLSEIWFIISGGMALFLFLASYRISQIKERKKAEEEKCAKETAACEARFKKLEEDSHNNSLKHTSAQLEREKLVDANNVRLHTLETKVSQVDSIASEVNLMKTRLEVQSTLINSMNSSLADMKSESRRQFDEVLYLLKNRNEK